jgi:hypothetical protein
MPSTDVQVHLQLARRNKRQEKRTISNMDLGDEILQIKTINHQH